MTARSFLAVIFDLGGVVLGSPLHAIASYERDTGLAPGCINRVVADTGEAGAWSQLERGQLPLEAFYPAFEADCAAAGHPVDARALMERIGATSGPRPQMLRAIGAIRARGLKTAALTNNWSREEHEPGPRDALRAHFDVFVESSVVGLQKPDPRIYTHTCRALAVEPARAVFLDDIGRNLKSARQLGMHTIKVDDPDLALAALESALGFGLRAPA